MGLSKKLEHHQHKFTDQNIKVDKFFDKIDTGDRGQDAQVNALIGVKVDSKDRGSKARQVKERYDNQKRRRRLENLCRPSVKEQLPASNYFNKNYY